MNAYFRHITDQLVTAINRRDGAAAVAVIDRIRRDGYPHLADEVTYRLVADGLRRMRNRHTN